MKSETTVETIRITRNADMKAVAVKEFMTYAAAVAWVKDLGYVAGCRPHLGATQIFPSRERKEEIGTIEETDHLKYQVRLTGYACFYAVHHAIKGVKAEDISFSIPQRGA